MTQRSSTKTRYRLMRPVNEWKLPHFMGAHLVSLSVVVKPQYHLKSSIRFELDFRMADL